MSRRSTALTPWQELEAEAYHAYREWPLFLKLRLRELRRHLPPEALLTDAPPSEEAAEPAGDDLALLRDYGLLPPEEPSSSEG